MNDIFYYVILPILFDFLLFAFFFLGFGFLLRYMTRKKDRD